MTEQTRRKGDRRAQQVQLRVDAHLLTSCATAAPKRVAIGYRFALNLPPADKIGAHFDKMEM